MLRVVLILKISINFLTFLLANMLDIDYLCESKYRYCIHIDECIYTLSCCLFFDHRMHHEISNEFQEIRNVKEAFGLNSRWDDIITEKQLVENLKLKIKELPPPVTVKGMQ